MVYIIYLKIRDDYALSPIGRPDIPKESGGIFIQTDLVPIQSSESLEPKKEWSQTISYIIFPDGLCLNIEESDKLSYVF